MVMQTDETMRTLFLLLNLRNKVFRNILLMTSIKLPVPPVSSISTFIKILFIRGEYHYNIIIMFHIASNDENIRVLRVQSSDVNGRVFVIYQKQ